VIPALREKLPAGHLYSRFLEDLRAAGFSGEITVSDADRTVLATDNSVYQIPPQAIIFPRTAADVELTMRLAAEPRFHAIVLTPRGGSTGTNGQSLTHRGPVHKPSANSSLTCTHLRRDFPLSFAPFENSRCNISVVPLTNITLHRSICGQRMQK
jgi:hypothetical protein